MNKTLYLLVLFPGLLMAKPLYEYGLGAGTGYLSDYPAADQGRIRTIVLPTFIYRGKVFRSDKKGPRARLLEGKTYNIDLSFGASFPTSDEENDTREGMDDLDWLGEIGPRLNFKLWHTQDATIQLELPVRFVFSTDFEFTKHRGYRFYPQIEYEKYLSEKVRFALSYKMNWATEELNDYFYEVSGSDITAERSAFDAKGGYIGKDITANIKYKYGQLFYILGIGYSNYENSTNENSPLHKADDNLSFFLAFNYFFYQSDEQGAI